VQAHGTASERCRRGICQRLTCTFWTCRGEGSQTRGSQDADAIERLVVGSEAVRRSYRRGLTVNYEHGASRAVRIDGRMEPIGECRAPADHRHAEATRGIGIAIGHGDCSVLVTGAVEAHADSVERRSKERRIVAHEAEHGLDVHRLDIVGEHLVDGRPFGGILLCRACHAVPPRSHAGPGKKGPLSGRLRQDREAEVDAGQVAAAHRLPTERTIAVPSVR
jgi:hypothetical protein